MARPIKTERNKIILELAKPPLSKPYAEIGKMFGISKSAVGQIVSRHHKKLNDTKISDKIDLSTESVYKALT